MIVSSFPRSGSTKYCLDLAKELNYTYYDEIFDLNVSFEHKQGLHEIHLDKIYPNGNTAAFIKEIDFSRAVINNHEMNYFTLANTDVFLTRKNVKDAVWSFVFYIIKYLVAIKKMDRKSAINVMQYTLRGRLAQAKFFYEYCHVHDKEMVIADLTYTDTNLYRKMFPEFAEVIDDFEKVLTLPNGLVYE
jgi:hypothetical protein